LYRWREEAEKKGRRIERIAVAFETGRDGFWLARWLRARGIATGDPATATVVANGPIHCLALQRDALHRLMKREPEIERAIDACTRQNLRDKFVEMNATALDRGWSQRRV